MCRQVSFSSISSFLFFDPLPPSFSLSFSHHCQVHAACVAGNPTVLADVRRLMRRPAPYIPASPQELCGELFHTCYMPTENSSATTRRLAEGLAKEVRFCLGEGLYVGWVYVCVCGGGG